MRSGMRCGSGEGGSLVARTRSKTRSEACAGRLLHPEQGRACRAPVRDLLILLTGWPSVHPAEMPPSTHACRVFGPLLVGAGDGAADEDSKDERTDEDNGLLVGDVDLLADGDGGETGTEGDPAGLADERVAGERVDDGAGTGLGRGLVAVQSDGSNRGGSTGGDRGSGKGEGGHPASSNAERHDVRVVTDQRMSRTRNSPPPSLPLSTGRTNTRARQLYKPHRSQQPRLPCLIRALLCSALPSVATNSASQPAGQPLESLLAFLSSAIVRLCCLRALLFGDSRRAPGTESRRGSIGSPKNPGHASAMRMPPLRTDIRGQSDPDPETGRGTRPAQLCHCRDQAWQFTSATNATAALASILRSVHAE
ncbi:hypothetical protein L1887_60641 [Cichorium endivia]|nr:hypothetical protein L1887_60641 [Cichorium endivia]